MNSMWSDQCSEAECENPCL